MATDLFRRGCPFARRINSTIGVWDGRGAKIGPEEIETDEFPTVGMGAVHPAVRKSNLMLTSMALSAGALTVRFLITTCRCGCGLYCACVVARRGSAGGANDHDE